MSDTLSSRYGTHRANRGVIVLAGLIGTLALAWVVWVVWVQSTPEVTSSQRSFDVADGHTASSTVAVRLRNDTVRATCLLRAYAEDHTVVGESHFAVPRDQGKRFDVTEKIRTERPATSVELVGCTAPGQRHPR